MHISRYNVTLINVRGFRYVKYNVRMCNLVLYKCMGVWPYIDDKRFARTQNKLEL